LAVDYINFTVSDPGKKQSVQDRKMGIKGLGDPVYLPQSQNIGFHTHDWAAEDMEGFIKLAHGYLLEGADRPSVCRFNASVGHLGNFGAIFVFDDLH
jgi:hypothetical protein